MGAQHFTVDFVPSGKSIACDSDDAIDGWELQGHDIPDEILAKLRLLLPNPKHWGDVEEFVSENDWGSDIRIWHDEGKVVAITLRYAPCIDPVATLHTFVSLAQAAGCDLLIRSTKEIVVADFEIMFEALKKHRAFRFLSDPEGAIKAAAREVQQND